MIKKIDMAESSQLRPLAISGNPVAFFLHLRQRFPFLHYIVLLHFVLLAFAVTGIFTDGRELMGINIWIKPTKFILTAIIVLWTMAWYFMAYPFQEKTKTILSIAAAVLMLIENILISLQAFRGVLSHYNDQSVFDIMVFSLMGTSIGLFTFLAFCIFIKSFSFKLKFSTAMKWSFRIAWFAFLFASAVGGSMVAENGHTIGVEDGGPGIPFFNWSTEGGDLRIAHFFGLHAIQIIPFVSWVISKTIKRNSVMTFLSIAFALLYLGWILFTFYQAKMGQSLF